MKVILRKDDYETLSKFVTDMFDYKEHNILIPNEIEMITSSKVLVVIADEEQITEEEYAQLQTDGKFPADGIRNGAWVHLKFVSRTIELEDDTGTFVFWLIHSTVDMLDLQTKMEMFPSNDIPKGKLKLIEVVKREHIRMLYPEAEEKDEWTMTTPCTVRIDKNDPSQGTLLILERNEICYTCGRPTYKQRMSYVWTGTKSKDFIDLGLGGSVKHYFSECSFCGSNQVG